MASLFRREINKEENRSESEGREETETETVEVPRAQLEAWIEEIRKLRKSVSEGNLASDVRDSRDETRTLP
jgi:hypothetical protein